jgi:hypothetical protein
LAYYLHWSWLDILDLDLVERRAFVELLTERITEENKQLEPGNGRI